MKNVHWTRKFTIAHKGKPNWDKGINEIFITLMGNGVYSAGVLFFDETNRQKGEAFFRLQHFNGASFDEVWNALDPWIDNFLTGSGGYEYVEK